MENRVNGHVNEPKNFKLVETRELPPKGPELWIHRLKANEKIELTIFSKTWWGCKIHMTKNSNRSSPHTEPEEECDGCIKGISLRWKFYLHCFDHKKRKQIFMEFTQNAAEQLEESLGLGANFRGVLMTLERGKTDNSRLKVTVQNSRVEESLMPTEKDPKPSLLNMWKFPEQEGPKKDFPFRDMFSSGR